MDNWQNHNQLQLINNESIDIPLHKIHLNASTKCFSAAIKRKLALFMQNNVPQSPTCAISMEKKLQAFGLSK